MAAIDLEMLLAGIETESPSLVLSRFKARSRTRHPGAPGYDLVLTCEGKPVATVCQDGSDALPSWTPRGNRSRMDSLRHDLRQAAMAYLEVAADLAEDLVLGGLAEGAQNGAAACLRYRTLCKPSPSADDAPSADVQP